MANPVLIADLEARFRPLAGQELAAAEAMLEDAWAVVVSTLPDLEDRIESGAVSVALVRSVVSAMVLRVLRNPDGIRQWSVDDVSFTRDNTLSAGGLYLSDAELALLNGRAATTRRRAFSIAPGDDIVRAPDSEYQYSWAPGYLR